MISELIIARSSYDNFFFVRLFIGCRLTASSTTSSPSTVVSVLSPSATSSARISERGFRIIFQDFSQLVRVTHGAGITLTTFVGDVFLFADDVDWCSMFALFCLMLLFINHSNTH